MFMRVMGLILCTIFGTCHGCGALTNTQTSTTATTGACGDGTDWTGFIIIPDLGKKASCGNGLAVDCQAAVKQSDCLLFTDFGFSLPTGAVITNVLVGFERYATSSDSGTKYVRDAELYIVKAGSATGSNKADTGTNWPTSATATTYSYTPAQWGTTISAGDVNNSGFGFSLSVNEITTAGTTQVAWVYQVNGASEETPTITITYRYGQKVFSQTGLGKVLGVDTLNVAKVAGASGT